MKVNLYKLILSVLFICFTSGLMAQVITITGTVTDGTDQTGIPGATVLEKGTSNGTVTDLDGHYSLKVSSPQDTLVISYIGFKKIEVPIGGRAIVDIVMTSTEAELEEVVVIGYGTQKKKVVTGAIATVNSEQIEKIPVLRVEQAMQGQAAGVQVTQMSGQPGEAPTVRIRGTGTTMDSNPLYVVDGMVVGGIDYLNPGDIQSIDVLKDAASAAIYGARAANGVVLITTKSGKGVAGTGTRLNFSTYYGIQNVGKTIDMLDADQYRMLMNEGARNANQSEPFDLNEVPNANTDWQDLMFTKNAPMQNYDLSVAGGNEKASYASSVSYFAQQGIIGGDKSQFERLTARLNGDVKATDWFTFGSDLAYSSFSRKGIASNGSFNTAYSSALNLDPLTPLYETDTANLSKPPFSNQPVVTTPDGKVYGISGYWDAAANSWKEYVGSEIVNPLALIEMQTGETRVDKFVGSIYGEITFLEGFKLKSSLGTDLAYVNWDTYSPLYYLNGAQSNTDFTNVSKSVDRYFNWQWENTLSYTKKIKDHNFSALVGTTAKEDNWESLSGFRVDVPLTDPDNVYLNMATNDTADISGGGASSYGLFSMFGRVTYDYKSRYAFTGIIRRDGSSNFGPNNRYGWFPSVGVSWMLTEENFMPQLGPVDFIKFRASWGVNGNDRIGYYQYVSTIDKSRGYIFGSGLQTGASPGYIENADIKWEESEQIDIALDAGLFNNRLTATVDYYIKNTNDLLQTIDIPGYVGNNAPVSNVGSVQNKGVEMTVNWRHYLKKLHYSAGVVAAYNKNKMTKIGNDQGYIWGASWAIAGPVERCEEGMPISYFYGYKTDGIFQTQNDVYAHIGKDGLPLQPNAKPGDVRFVDVNGDNKIDEKDRTYIGNPTPDWTLGINGSVDYMNFDLSFLFVGAFGQEIFNGAQRQDLLYTNRPVSALGRWTGEGTSNEIPRYTWSDVNNNYRVSDLYIENGSYLRLKNIQIGYTLPKKFLERIKSSSWRFYVSAENLVTFTGYSGADPEIGAMSSLDIGIDRGMYPSAVTFRFGTSISF
jgi:TonB-linked SusC/RagA family outer membrane protein